MVYQMPECHRICQALLTVIKIPILFTFLFFFSLKSVAATIAVESFETDLGIFQQSTADDIDWQRKSGYTPSNSTGPNGASAGSQYLYIEASNSSSHQGYPNKTAIITSQAIDLSNAVSAQLKFDYHMYGQEMGKLEVLLSSDNSNFSSVWSRNGDQGNKWFNQETINLDNHLGKNLYIRFKGTTGSKYRSDIAIDNINIISVSTIIGNGPRTFSTRHSKALKGNFEYIGNTLLHCTANCVSNNHNKSFMRYVDIDNDNNTFNSSSADIALPNNAEITWAGLYWGGTAGINTSYWPGISNTPSLNKRNEVQFKSPNGSYQTVKAQQLDSITDSPTPGWSAYQAFADVTSLVQQGGIGTYTIANVQLDRNKNASGNSFTNPNGGWNLVVFYKSPTEQYRHITLWDGYDFIYFSSANKSFTLNNIRTPISGTFESEIAFTCYDGELTDGNGSGDGDFIAINNTNQKLSNNINPTTNICNGSISKNGQNVTTRNPASNQNWAFDVDRISFNETGIIPNNANSIEAIFGSNNEGIWFDNLVLSTELFNPPQANKRFSQPSVVSNTITPMHITLRNDNVNGSLQGISFTDIYPNGLKNAATSVIQANTCGGSLTAPTNGTSLSFSRGSLAAGQSCTITVNVVGLENVQGTILTNCTSQISSTSTESLGDKACASIEITERPIEQDFGDAPIQYGTPIHQITNTLYIGVTPPDAETNHQASNNATGDDNNGNPNDEDALSSLVNLDPTQSNYSLDIPLTNSTGSNATLHGWIDLNGDGKFGTNEHQHSTVATGTHTKKLTWTNFPASMPKNTFVRLRVTTDALNDNSSTSDKDERATLLASDGEVEDYKLIINDLPPPPTFSCTADTYFFTSINTNSPTDIYSINLDNGNTQKIADDFYTQHINAVGYNRKDNYVWGYDFGKHQLARIDANLGITNFDVAGLPNNAFYSGDVSPDGVLHLFLNKYQYQTSPGNFSAYITRIDVDPSSTTYLQKLPDLPLSGALDGILNIGDFAFNPVDNMLYAIHEEAPYGLYKINPNTGVVTEVIANLNQQLPTGHTFDFHSTLFDVDGNLYFYGEGKKVYKINLSNPNNPSSPSHFSTLTASTDNGDSARCSGAPSNAKGSLTGNIYIDSNGNDLFDNTEATLENIKVMLYTDQGTASFTDDTLVQIASSNTHGQYSFNNLPEATYRIGVDTTDIDIPNNHSLGTPNPLTNLHVTANQVNTKNNFGFDPKIENITTVGEYRFDDCGAEQWLQDYSSHGNNAIAQKKSIIETDGKDYACSSVKGYKTYVKVPHIDAHKVHSGAISLLIYDHHNIWENAVLLDKTGASGKQLTMNLKRSTDAQHGTISVTLDGHSIDTGETYLSASGDGSDLDSQWVHVVFTFGTQGMKLYINGELKGNNPHNGGIETLSSAIKLPHFSGYYDEFYLLSGQPDDQRVKQIYDNLLANKNLDGTTRTCDCQVACSLIVTNTSDRDNSSNNSGSLRDAIECANQTPGTDTIQFNIPRDDSGYINPDDTTGNTDDYWSIKPQKRLPYITDTIEIIGSTQPGYTNKPIIELDGSQAGSVEGLFLSNGSNGSTIQGLIINRFRLSAIELRDSSNHVVKGNYIGVDSSATQARSNGDHGIEIAEGSGNNTIGGTDPKDGNVISANQDSGIRIDGSGANTIKGNIIGLGLNDAALGNNNHGIYLRSSYNTIGGPNASMRNVIADSGYNGILLADVTETTIQGNYIGTNQDGTQKRGNHNFGIKVSGNSNNLIGGSGHAGNLISGNDLDGVMLDASNNNRIQGNKIGSSADGTQRLGNIGNGLTLRHSQNNQVGGDTTDLANIIVANGDRGIWLRDTDTTNNKIRANRIGVSADGSTALGNDSHGIEILEAKSNQLTHNLIANNGADGVSVRTNSALNNSILANSIHSNNDLGIDLNNDGVTQNDSNDVDSGPNHLLNYPEVTKNTFTSNGTRIITYNQLTLDVPAGDYRMEFFTSSNADSSGHGEGEIYLGHKTLKHTGSGPESFTGSFNASQNVPKDSLITVTLTMITGSNSYGSTSEFSGIKSSTPSSVCTDLINDDNGAVTIDENSKVISLLRAKDSNGNPITYIISGGADARSFIIRGPENDPTLDCSSIEFLYEGQPEERTLTVLQNRATLPPGAFLPPPGNYEVPMDADKDNTYDLIIRATLIDGQQVERVLHVRIMDVNEAPFITSTTDVSIIEDSTLEVVDIEAHDQDMNQTEGNGLSYHISGGEDAAHFQIDSASGVLRFQAVPDYDAPADKGFDNLYRVEVTVTDAAGLSGMKAFRINVLNNTTDDGISLRSRVLLQGAYQADSGLMQATLHNLALLPTNQPYSVTPFNYAGSETYSSLVANATGADAMVDWVLLELRDAGNAILAQRAVILQRDGDLVDPNSGSVNLHFASLSAGSYHVAVRHRNHLDLITAHAVSLVNAPQTVDFSLKNTAVRGEEARLISGDTAFMWAGDINANQVISANGPSNDVTTLLSSIITNAENPEGQSNYILHGYSATDLNLDGKTLFTGPANDASLVVGNIILHPLNATYAANYIVRGSLE